MTLGAWDRAQGATKSSAHTPPVSFHIPPGPGSIPTGWRSQSGKGAYPLPGTERGNRSNPDLSDSSSLWAAQPQLQHSRPAPSDLPSPHTPLGLPSAAPRVPGPSLYLKVSTREGGGFIPPQPSPPGLGPPLHPCSPSRHCRPGPAPISCGAQGRWIWGRD